MRGRLSAWRERASAHFEQMVTPGRQGDEQPLVSELVAAPLERAVIEQVGESPAAAAHVGPAEPDPSLGGLAGEVDHYQMPAGAVGPVVSHPAVAVSGPRPGEKVAAGI